ncbi:ATP-binding protein [Streptomyces sp. NPDC048324]|uniref:ATP-binding protein n=1 Tax=Streptomyces sp. NPDC048324 TaxID=3157205 RepID=UPI00343B8166
MRERSHSLLCDRRADGEWEGEILGQGGLYQRRPAKTGPESLFQVFTEREERRAISIASNASFSAWKQTITDLRLRAAIADRGTFNANPRPVPTASASPRPRRSAAARRDARCQ